METKNDNDNDPLEFQTLARANALVVKRLEKQQKPDYDRSAEDADQHDQQRAEQRAYIDQRLSEWSALEQRMNKRKVIDLQVWPQLGRSHRG